MGKFTFKLPDIGEGIAEAEIVAWHVKVGDRIEEDGKIADVMTDKATVEMESPVSGVILSVAGEEGDMVAIGSPLVVIEIEGEGEPEGDSAAPVPAPAVEPELPSKPAEISQEPARPAPVAESPDVSAAEPKRAGKSDGAPSTERSNREPGHTSHAKVLASPAVRARASELGIDLAQIKPAEDGRLRHSDLDAFLAYNAQGGFRPAGAKGVDQAIKVMGLRRRIAENMAASKRSIPHFSYVEECDVTALETLRAQLNTARGDRPKLTMLPLLITAICRTLP
ncbi:MAG: 2-oxo acid dehydrogenase subunit E2, partial [Sphingomonadales bacterium]|nr:2-oxo acid dehydrogenase subunit E2 [Sphingomonadales bacterium]